MRYVAIVLLVACGGVDPIPPRPPTPQEEDACDAFCELIASLGCDGHEGSPGPDEQFDTGDDVPCSQVCHDIHEGNAFTANRACLDNARTCERAEQCIFEGGLEID